MVRIDLHVHTNYSDGTDSPEEIIQQAEKIGLDGIAITDHDTYQGLHKALEIETDLLIVPGIEISSTEGHILAYGLTDADIEKGLTPKETVDKIHRYGGIAVPAHPFDFIRLGIKKAVFSIASDAIEVINGCCTLPYWNKKARKVALELDLPMIAGSDGHSIHEIGVAWTDFVSEPRTWQEVISAIMKKECIPLGKTHPVILSKIRRFWRTLKKRKERPVPYEFIWKPKEHEK
ncbi:MAG: CehA/McbA family metallohydrolase [Asgard group archaeon]|nr:CehA/McbA family metallohydrolase [Asgard group archaeon]